MANSEWAQQAKERNRQWLEKALPAFEAYCKTHQALTSELFRATYSDEPEDSNTWGSLTLIAKERGWVVDSGHTMNAQRESSNGRRIPVWYSKIFEEIPDETN